MVTPIWAMEEEKHGKEGILKKRYEILTGNKLEKSLEDRLEALTGKKLADVPREDIDEWFKKLIETGDTSLENLKSRLERLQKDNFLPQTNKKSIEVANVEKTLKEYENYINNKDLSDYKIIQWLETLESAAFREFIEFAPNIHIILTLDLSNIILCMQP